MLVLPDKVKEPNRCEIKNGYEYAYEYQYEFQSLETITGIINRIILEIFDSQRTVQLEIHKLARDKSVLDLGVETDLAIFQEIANKRDEKIYSWRKQLEPVIYYIVEHYRDSVFDICNVECDIMNWFWEGDAQEHIDGGGTVQDLRNRRLLNMLTRRLLSAITEYRPSEIDTKSLWNSKDREEILSKREFCRFCKKFTHQYENFCPGCRNWSSNFEGSIK